MKTLCFKCKNRKELTSFYTHPEMSNGHIGKCKTCTKRDVLENRLKNLERIRLYDRERSKLPHRAEMHGKIRDAWRKEHPGGFRSHNKVRYALKSGRLKKPNCCSKCTIGGVRLDAHHPDYRKHLLIKWLCLPCHRVEHKSMRKH